MKRDDRDRPRSPGAPGATKAPSPDTTARTQGTPAPTETRIQAPSFAAVKAPSLSLPQGGGSIRGLGETFRANPQRGTAGLAVPFGLPGARGFTPDLGISYDSGGGQGLFGMGWQLSVPSITRKTDKGLPRYLDSEDSDTFVLAGAEDLVPALRKNTSGEWELDERENETETHRIRRYRPRIEGAFSRIERWTRVSDGDVHWVVTTGANVRMTFGTAPSDPNAVPARISDPEDPGRVFCWFLDRIDDDRGNVALYEYVNEGAENLPDGPQERHRRSGAPFTNTYLKRVRYGNTTPASEPGHEASCVFEVVFDYGDHDADVPTPERLDPNPWPARLDPFSSYRAGFEIRTYRLCRRVLVFHRFADLGTTPYLVRSIDFGYQPDPIATLLTSVTAAGYVRLPDDTTYERDELPSTTFVYSKPTRVPRELAFDGPSLADVKAGSLGRTTQWADVDGEGLPGLLADEGPVVTYKRNLGGGKLAPARRLPSRPTMRAEQGHATQLLDLEGRGEMAIVSMNGPVAGYHERRSEDDGWGPFVPFASLPNVDWSSSQLTLIDLDGDGWEDLLVVSTDSYLYFPSLGKRGYGPPRRIQRHADLEPGAALSFFADERRAVFFADMTGDGLADLVLVQSGSVSYWPNLGYGKFGARVRMAGSPDFAKDGHHDARRVKLADLDGSGPADLFYTDGNGLRVWFNQAGNGWSAPAEVPGFRLEEGFETLSVVDAFGRGAACITWAPRQLRGPGAKLRALDLTGDVKPYLLTEVKNNLGLTTRVAYAPSTKFALADRAAGRPWATKLPFPVQVVERVEVYEAITKTRLVTTYAYHHGYFDPDERELRGFGLVEQRDAESVSDTVGQGLFSDMPPAENGELTSPPVVTRTWFHTGAWRDRERLEAAYRKEYYSPEAPDPDPRLLSDTLLPSGLAITEEKDACRSLKGSVLRTEVYSQDGSDREAHPYTVTEQSYTLVPVQPETRDSARGTRAPAVFFVHAREAVTATYERHPTDPRVAHQMTLEVDDFGVVRKQATIAYGRTGTGAPEQAKTWMAVSESDVAHIANEPAGYRLAIPTEARAFELTGVGTPSEGLLYSLTDIVDAIASAGEPSSQVEMRLLGRVRHRYYDKNDLTNQTPLDPGEVDLLALPYDSHSLAFTTDDLAEYGGRVTTAMLQEGGYVQLLTGSWWIPSGRTVFDPDNFYLPAQVIDAFGQTTAIAYDSPALFVVGVTDPLGNSVTAEIDYRVLAPKLVTDPNGNRGAARFDRLGRVVATAVMGKVGSTDGDTLDEPTTRFTYVTDAFETEGRPNHVKAEARETHGDPQTRWQVSYAYADGLGRAAMTKVQAEPGMAPERDENGALLLDQNGKVVLAFATERWVGTGRTVFDNKGQPIKQYEPYFSSVPDFENEAELVLSGVTPILRYDPLGRLIRTDLPNGTYSRVELDAWSQTAFDPNDTTGEEGNAWTLARAPTSSATDEEKRATVLALDHAGTPATSHVDALGRVFLVEARLTASILVPARTELDIEGQVLSVRDALGADSGPGRLCANSTYATGGQTIRSMHIDSGEGFSFADVHGAPLYAWDAVGHRVRTELDLLRRVIRVWVQKGSDPEWLSQRIVYGEAATEPEDANLCGRVLYHFDGAGLSITDAYDFKGNVLTSSRQLATTYDTEPDWSALATLTDPVDLLDTATSLLEAETFSKTVTYDALNRPTSMVQPDSSEILPSYNEAGLLDGVGVKIRGASAATTFVEDIDYDVKGRREKIEYGNGTTTTYDYDPLTYRLTRLKTTRASDSAVLQNLFYTYDPVGNIVAIEDTAHETVFFANQQVNPSAEYEYDALYRLVKATGREHAGGIGDDQRDNDDLPLWNLPHPNNAQALRNYTEEYEYDLVGNIKKMIHSAAGSSAGSWTRRYAYGDDPFGTSPSAVPETNRLHSTSLPGDDPEGPFTATYAHDTNGNMVAMPHLASIVHTHKNQMREADLGGGGTAYYTYDASGERVRKVIQRLGTTREERIYLGGWELYRKRQGASQDIVLERETLHVMDDTHRIAMVETKTVDADVPGTLTIVSRIRFQLDNHLGTACLEVDDAGLVISYEEYHPYGTSSYRSAKSGVEVSEKRYRYTGKERDEETGFGYHSARYYAPWLGRWTSADPVGMVDGPNTFVYACNDPCALADSGGTDSTDVLLTGKLKALVNTQVFGRPPDPPPARALTTDQSLAAIMKKDLGIAPRAPAPPKKLASHISGPITQKQRRALEAGAEEKLNRPQGKELLPSAAVGPQIRHITPQEYNDIVSTSRCVPGYGLGVSGAVALGQSNPDKLMQAGEFASATMAAGQMAHAAQATANAHNALQSYGGSRKQIVGAAQSPRTTWAPNADGPRTLAEALKIAESVGVNLPEDVHIVATDKYIPENAGASYLAARTQQFAGQRITWNEFYRNVHGKMIVRIRPELLKSDEAFVANLAHELHEIEGLRQIFEETGGSMTLERLHRLIGEGTKGNLHDQAWDVADAAVIRLREAKK